MIFASVGSFLPFDRFVRSVDEWAGEHPGEEVFIQIGGGTYEPQHAQFARMVTPADYRRRLAACDLFVAHVGMGSILQAMEAKKQMLLMVRNHRLGEHTTDHQAATAARFRNRQGLRIVDSPEALKNAMGELLANPLVAGGDFSTKASPELIGAVACFLKGGWPPPVEPNWTVRVDNFSRFGNRPSTPQTAEQ